MTAQAADCLAPGSRRVLVQRLLEEAGLRGQELVRRAGSWYASLLSGRSSARSLPGVMESWGQAA